MTTRPIRPGSEQERRDPRGARSCDYSVALVSRQDQVEQYVAT